jgi:hypothetical protein
MAMHALALLRVSVRRQHSASSLKSAATSYHSLQALHAAIWLAWLALQIASQPQGVSYTSVMRDTVKEQAGRHDMSVSGPVLGRVLWETLYF